MLNNGYLKDKFDRSISLICWAYNEEKSIKEYLERATKLMDATVEDYEIVLIDDCSTDRTNEIAKAFQKENPRLKVFRNERNLNVGISCQRAIQKTSKEYLFWQTIDWSYDISNLREFLEYLKENDIVYGVRRKPVDVKIKFLKPFVLILKLFGIKQLTKRSDTIKKAFVSLINYLLVRFLFRMPISDYQNIGFYPTKWIQSLKIEGKSSFVGPEILLKAYWNGMSIKEVPISFIPRTKGIGKGIKSKAIISSVKDIFRLWFKWIILRKRGTIKKGKIIRLDIDA